MHINWTGQVISTPLFTFLYCVLWLRHNLFEFLDFFALDLKLSTSLSSCPYALLPLHRSLSRSHHSQQLQLLARSGGWCDSPDRKGGKKRRHLIGRWAWPQHWRWWIRWEWPPRRQCRVQKTEGTMKWGFNSVFSCVSWWHPIKLCIDLCSEPWQLNGLLLWLLVPKKNNQGIVKS